MQRSKRGFTLIELLVVIAIIAVLAAILFPVFARAREQARAGSCLSNIKQLGLAFQMYAQDNEGNYPIMHYDAAVQIGDTVNELHNGHAPASWYTSDPDLGMDYIKNHSYRAQLDPYVKNAGVFKCPSDSGGVWGATGTNWDITKRFSSYHYRFWFSLFYFPVWGPIAPHAMPFSDGFLKDTARVFCLSETLPFHDLRPPANAPANLGGWVWMPDVKRNYAFCDGHAKAMPVNLVELHVNWFGDPWNQYGFDYHWPRQQSWDIVPKRYDPATEWWTTSGSEFHMDLDP